jgi:flagellar hook capping protein FlgD
MMIFHLDSLPQSSYRFRVPCLFTFLILLLWASPGVASTIYEFGGQFINGDVYSTTYFNGDIIAGGPFNSAGAVAGSKYLARWDGAQWAGMNMPGAYYTGPGASGAVEVVAVHQGKLYVAGHMLADHGALSDHIMSWNGTSWSGLRYGVNGVVYALLSSGNDLYVGGEFISAGAVPMNRMARWDGTNWNALGSGLDWAPVAIVEYGGEIVACGAAYSIGGNIAAISAWNGTTWHQLGQSLGYSEVNDLEVWNGILVAAGRFTLAGGSNLAWLDGDTWRPLGGGTDDGVNALAVAGSRLYVLGGFYHVGNGPTAIPAVHIAAWDGAVWSALTSGIDGPFIYSGPALLDLTSDGTNVVVSGAFESAGGLDSPNLAIWNGSAWSNELSNHGNGLNSCVNEPAHVLLTSGRSLIVGGAFTWAGGQAANRIARWDGVWHTYGNGLGRNSNGLSSEQVYALAEFNGTLVAGGSFTVSGSQPVNHIAEWDGTNWNTLGSGLDGTVYALAVYNGQLVAGGSFTGRIAWWNGTAWQSTGVPGGFTVRVLTVCNGELYASYQGNAGLRKWNGVGWVDTGFPFSAAESMTKLGNDLIVAGTGANQLARWNGTAWSYLPTPMLGPFGITNYNGTLVGTGTLSSGQSGIIALDGGLTWTLMAEATWLFNNDVVMPGSPIAWKQANLVHDAGFVKGLFVTGNFVRMGGAASCRIALINPEFLSTGIDEKNLHSWLEATPNPFQKSLAIRFSLETPARVEAMVVDLGGRKVATVLDQMLPSGTHEISWDGRDVQGKRVPPGVYFIRAREGARVESREVVLLQ